MLHMYSIQNAMLVFILIVTAVVLAASGFRISIRKENGFFHSLPISREMLYTVTCLDGILYLAVPYLVFLLAAGVMLQVKGAPFSWGTLLIGYVQHMCFYTGVHDGCAGSDSDGKQSDRGFTGNRRAFSWEWVWLQWYRRIFPNTS